jgi:hypothetical protein
MATAKKAAAKATPKKLDTTKDTEVVDRDQLPEAEESQVGQDGYETSTAKLYGEALDKQPEGAPLAPHVGMLDSDGEVAARTAPDAEADGKFRHTFTISGRDYDENADNDDMHRANEVATLQNALNKGVHPKGEAYLESSERTQDGSVNLTYAVESIPAHEDEAPGDSQVPSKAIDDMGGSTVEHAQNSVRFGTATADDTK